VAALFATGQVWHIVAALAAAGVVVPLLLVSVDYWLRFGAVEYRTDSDAIVAYDQLFGHALWRIEPWDEIDLRVERDRLDTFLNTDSIVVTLRDDSIIQIPRVPDSEPILDVFDRQPDGVSPAGEEL
ncbi:MAG: PH domain-containing protein, partial [Haloarculaceae archaeon]